MGYFSWETADTCESIPNRRSGRDLIPVKMLDDKGNEWVEYNYEGYGDFGGKDFYELLSEMNGGPSDRHVGIDMEHDKVAELYCKLHEYWSGSIPPEIERLFDGLNTGNKLLEGPKKPKIVTLDCKLGWAELPNNKRCFYQGFFYYD